MRLSRHVPAKYPHSSRTVDGNLFIAKKLKKEIGPQPNCRSDAWGRLSQPIGKVGRKFPSSDKRDTVFPAPRSTRYAVQSPPGGLSITTRSLKDFLAQRVDSVAERP